ncbi:MAG: bacteriohopanetetrol glucosamine biosynthesis glycosyltransferase HpnI [Acidobacteriia bacterium]|nr:bacteriohopanetetrol glucosamine biosynthesis glycosyltransferase HpnI [Terriglobia bacterium]
MRPAAVPAFAAAAYQLLAVIAALGWRRRRPKVTSATPPISLLKPMYGRDEHLYRALRSHAGQDYPKFEILFGVARADDPALQEIARLRAEFPALSVRLIEVQTDAVNPKAAVVARLAKEARYSLLVINDDDIEVERNYFRTIAALLTNPGTGLVTCLYRARAESWAARMEALGIATDFAPSVMVARLLGVAEFALGATMAVRADTLHAIGGLEPIAQYLADDYELGRRITAAGFRVEFAPVVVETGLGGASLKQVWQHQLRWSRTIRVSRPGGYYGSVITNATIWALVAFAAGEWQAGLTAAALRFTAAWCAGNLVLSDREVRRSFWLIPFRDLFGFAVWVTACFGNTVYWRGRKLYLARNGRLTMPSS